MARELLDKACTHVKGLYSKKKDMKFDAIVANPPYSAQWSADPKFMEDERFSAYGKLAPKSKADFVLINGKAVVYEIKTELDNFDRLGNQINDYYKAFDHVAVVTCKENLQVLKKKIEMIGKPVGIYILQKRGTITTIQKPQAYSVELDAEILFKILRKQEYEEILFNKYKHLPDVSEFKYYSECKKMFLEIPLEEAYLSVLKLLKKRSQIIKDEFSKIPYELKFLAYFMNLKSDDYKKITKFLNESYGGV